MIDFLLFKELVKLAIYTILHVSPAKLATEDQSLRHAQDVMKVIGSINPQVNANHAQMMAAVELAMKISALSAWMGTCLTISVNAILAMKRYRTVISAVLTMN